MSGCWEWYSNDPDNDGTLVYGGGDSSGCDAGSSGGSVGLGSDSPQNSFGPGGGGGGGSTDLCAVDPADYDYMCDPDYDDGTQPVAGSWLSFPWRLNVRYLYFNMAHFWNQHLSCYLQSTQDEFMDQTNADFQRRIAAGTAPSVPGSGTSFDYSFNDRGTPTPIRYKVGLPNGSTDWVVGTAYIPGRPNC